MMRTSCRLAILLLLSLPALPAAAQGVFVVTDVKTDGVLVSPVDTGAKKLSEITAGFTRFDIFDVYASRGTDSFLTDFVDSLSYDSTTPDGILLRYVWKGENKFLKRGFFAVRTGRVYVTGSDEAVSHATVSQGAAGPVKGSFGVPGLTVAAGVGAGAIQDLLTPGAGATTAATMVSARIWYRFIGASIRAGLPLSSPLQMDNAMGCLLVDLGYDALPFWTLYASVGYSIGSGSGIAVAAGTSFLIPLLGADRSFALYADIAAVAPNVLSLSPYLVASLGVKL